MFIRFRNMFNFSDFYFFKLFLFNKLFFYLIELFFYIKNSTFFIFLYFICFKTVSYRIFEKEISEIFGMVSIVFNFLANFET